MSAQAPTPNWSDRQFQIGESASWSWSVVADTEAEAALSVPYQAGSSHPYDSSLKAEPPSAANDGGPNYWKVTVNWSKQGQGTLDSQKPQISWAKSSVSEPFDRDPDGNAITNSAGDGFSNPASTEVSERQFTITRFESFYDLALAEEFENTTNEDDLTFLGRYNFSAGQLRCSTIIPTSRYVYDANLIEIAYTFDIRRDGWKLRIKDQGRRGLYTNDDGETAHAEIYDGDGTQVSSDVALNGGGVPMDPTYKVGRNGEDDRSPGSVASPPGAEVERGPGDIPNVTVWLKYLRYRETDFGGLGL